MATRGEIDVLSERERQRARHGDDHDDVEHAGGTLALAAGSIARPDAIDNFSLDGAPAWARDYVGRDYRERLVIGAALLLAELERVDRARTLKAERAGTVVVDRVKGCALCRRTCGSVLKVKHAREGTRVEVGCHGPPAHEGVHRGTWDVGQSGAQWDDHRNVRIFGDPAWVPDTNDAALTEPIDGYPQFARLVLRGAHEWIDPGNLTQERIERIRDARAQGAVLEPPANGRADFRELEELTAPRAGDPLDLVVSDDPRVVVGYFMNQPIVVGGSDWTVEDPADAGADGNGNPSDWPDDGEPPFER